MIFHSALQVSLSRWMALQRAHAQVSHVRRTESRWIGLRPDRTAWLQPSERLRDDMLFILTPSESVIAFLRMRTRIKWTDIAHSASAILSG
jgi:hypothetical protein